MRKIQLKTKGVNWRREGNVVGKFIATLQAQIQEAVERAFNEGLDAEAEAIVGRRPHQRRGHRGRRMNAVCQRCGTHNRVAWVRNGYRRRQLVTQWGILAVDLPRLRCVWRQCASSVQPAGALSTCVGRRDGPGSALA